MARPLTTLVVFFISLNLIASALMGAGIASTLGLDANVGGDEAVDERVGNDVESGTSTGSTLFGMYNVLSGQLSDLFGVVFPGLNMLERAGVPSWITGGILGPLFSVLIFIDVISFLRGWGL